MKTFKLLLLSFITLTLSLRSQDNKLANGLGMGFQINQYQKDFGIGINLTSPFVAQQHLGLRMRANLVFNEHNAVSSGEITWTPYSNISLGFIGVGGMVGDFIRLYGEGGVICLLPSSSFSSQTSVFGGYGIFGFEFFMSQSFNYFIEIGGVGTGAIADKVVSKPIYSNGLLITAGFRFYL